MILQALVRRYEDTVEVKPGWQRREVSYALDITEDGKLLGVVPLGDQIGKRRGQLTLTLPSIGSGRSGKNAADTAYFLCDDGNYMLGVDARKFESARRLHTKLFENLDTPVARAITAYFNSGIPALPPDVEPTDKFIFMVNGRRVDYADGGAETRDAWESAQKNTKKEVCGLCLVTGKRGGIRRLHDKVELRGVTMSKQPLISMNDQTSFRSYGKQPGNPPTEIGEEAAFAYAAALNALLKEPTTHQPIGKEDTLVYWAEDGSGEEENVFSWTSRPTEEEDDAAKIAALMEHLALGKAVENCNMESRFYLLCLSPNAARISVRFFHVDTFGKILKNNLQHYCDIDITGQAFYYGKRSIISPEMILAATTVKNKAADATPLLGGQLMRSILLGENYPLTLYCAILSRIRSSAEIDKTKAAIVKAVLVRNYHESEVTTVALNKDSTNIPYTLGRLFAALEQLQWKASGGNLNTTIKDKYFSSACTNPASVFPILLKLSIHHAAKADSAQWLESLKMGLIGRLSPEAPFPTALSLDDQGRFIIGYYHQRQDFFTAKDKETSNE